MDSKLLSPSCRLLPLLVLVVASAPLLAANQAASQSGSPLSGTVTNEDGKPIAGVAVVGSIWKDCCPAQRDNVLTDGDGDFRIDHPGAVLHFIQGGFEPQTIVVKPDTTHLRVILSPATSDWMIPACGKSKHGLMKIGAKYGIRFLAPLRFVRVDGGKPDTDYIRYVIHLKKDHSYMDIWFGPYTIPTDPDDELFINSIQFSQRNIGTSSVNDAFFGVDSSGRLQKGGSWRWTAILGRGGAVYKDASSEDSKIFDEIIDSMCFAARPKR